MNNSRNFYITQIYLRIVDNTRQQTKTKEYPSLRLKGKLIDPFYFIIETKNNIQR